MPPKTTKKKDQHDDSKVEKVKSGKPKVKKQLIVRPLITSDYKKYATAIMSQTTLEDNEINKGGFVSISIGLNELVLIADSGDVDDDVILIHPAYLRLHNTLLGERCTVEPFKSQLEYATTVDIVSTVDVPFEDLVDIGIVYDNLYFDNWKINTGVVEKLESLSLESRKQKGWIIHPKNTKLEVKKVAELKQPPLRHSFFEIGGCDKEIKLIRQAVRTALENGSIFEQFGLQPPHGLIVHGASGVGKTMVLQALSYELKNVHVLKIDGSDVVSKYLGDSEEKVRSIFKEATRFQPSIVLIDGLEKVAPGSNGGDEAGEVEKRVANVLSRMLEDLSGKVVVVAATNEINAVDLTLRRPGRLDIEIELGVPDQKGRYEILCKMLSKMVPNVCNIEDVEEIASKTHGYVGSDLLLLVRECVLNAVERFRQGSELAIYDDDFKSAMREVRPSALKEVVLEMPTVHWSDIGGQHELRRKLYEMVELPLKEGERFAKLGISAPKGLLLYGPPGCSKTLTAKALATESGLNFLAIKGPELFNKYVGESERKLRAVFAKARQSAPAVVFIDEIDAIALDREGEGNGVGAQVLNTLLNELDGVEELRGVIVVGATNRPWALDSALIRPGRLDRHVYVGLPDNEARKEIFTKATSKFGLECGLDELVKETEGLSGAECVLVAQEAGLSAISRGSDVVIWDDFTRVLSNFVRGVSPEIVEQFIEWGNR
ncbi:hypothetical protein CANINC_003893 [Pichia inconspicua]|uniref:AAA+ ATPase domain-containing protein n=1 Tax=Pichia inconspicua TaxID=52247 RepID=A0A4T0WYJ6_9ASCO|nr:hypothetical protein CANINC_003893 [[Candida] inconspicua]